jgi:hypothetical protein
MRTKKRFLARLFRFFLPLGVGLCVLLYFSAALSNLDSGQSEESLRQLEDSIRRASVACYASEGVYPPSLDYLKAHYGLQINETRYTVFYEVFAENLMPAITVLEKGT